MMRTRVKRAAVLSVGMAVISVFLVGYETTTVSNGGTIRGTVKLQGNPPHLAAHKITKAEHRPICGDSVPNEEVVAGSGGALANVVVWIDGIQSGAAPTRHNITLDQHNCRYTPHVQATTRGSQVTVTSQDPTLHNTHATMGNRTIFNLALPTKGVRINRPLSRPGLIDVKCDAGHTWMRAYIHVFEHPYFAVTGADGRFELTQVPPGQHTLKAWHERFGTQTRSLRVDAGGTVTWDVQMH